MKITYATKQMTKHDLKVRYFLTIAIIFLMVVQASSQFVLPGANSTPTYEECISFYKNLDLLYEDAQLLEVGTTDIGKPLHLFVLNNERVFYPELLNHNKLILLINNGIHPGEPDGVNASMMLAQQLLDGSSTSKSILEHVIICIVPIYNVDGALNRNSYSRANQLGPESYGFRGNAKNLDLNRDFIKCDSKNAQSFNRMFTALMPHVFVDTHVSNGADYPYTMTLITTQSDKLGGSAGAFVKGKMEPALFSAMEKAGDKMCPYVNTMGRTPESGLIEFFETPRFASGYAALYNTIGFITETHMLKPFDQRVQSTFLFLKIIVDYADKNHQEIIEVKRKSDDELMKLKSMTVTWELDTSRRDEFEFEGYEAKMQKSKVGDGEQLYYDRNSPWKRKIPFLRNFKSAKDESVPQYYIIPQAWTDVIDRLKMNHVVMSEIGTDTTLGVFAYVITDYETMTRPYEGHYLHSNMQVSKTKIERQFFRGDVVVEMNQPARRYIFSVLEPECEDSFFAWNFFDSVLQQKEWFSDYVFEDIAAALLKSNKTLKAEFDKAMSSDPEMKGNHWNQLYWVYQHSPYFEKSVNVYPVFRME